MNGATFRRLGLVLTAWLLLFPAAPARGQLRGVELTIAPEQIGLGGAGVVRPGTWAPLRLIIDNQAFQPRKVICEVSAPDADGDQVLSRRLVTLNPQRNTVWLYVMVTSIRRGINWPEVGGRLAVDWRVRVIEVPDRTTDVNSDVGRLLANKRIVDVSMADPRSAAIGVLGRSALGLRPYESVDMWTQHELIQVLRGMDAQNLPDRWHGLSMLQTLVWTAEVSGGDPGSPQFSDDSRQAVRQWVRRGGHLIVILPRQNGAELWQKSPLADLLPSVTATPLPGIPAPEWLRGLRTESITIDAYALDPVDGPDGAPAAVSKLLYSEAGQPLVVARQYGLGRVTLVGVDLTDRRLAGLDLPNANFQDPNPVSQRFWATLFLWRGPVFSQEWIDGKLKDDQLGRVHNRQATYLDAFVPGLVAMRNTAAPVLALAIVVFGFYWLAAGPVSFATLKGMERQRKSWLAFTVVVLVFSLVTWAGALWVRPHQSRIEHFSFVDIDGPTGTTWGHSWLSVFVPTHGRVELALDPDNSFSGATIANPGLEQTADAAAFVNPQQYVVDAGNPSRLSLPMRSTAKQLELDYLGRPDSESPWASIHATQPIRLENGILTGQLVHNLPGTLSNVMVFCCPGDGQEPYSWSVKDWSAGKTLDLGKVLDPNLRLFYYRPSGDKGGGYDWSEFLQKLQVSPETNKAALVALLSLYSTLPPPKYWKAISEDSPDYFRTTGRGLDLTRLLHLRRVIVIGNLDPDLGGASPLPLPLTVDGRPLPSSGFTAVRWVGELEP